MTTTLPAAFLDLHVIQTVPLSALNRDGDGNPKSVVIGGVTRARLSPQAVKRPVRLHIEKALPEEAAVRTRRLVHEIRDILLRDHWAPAEPDRPTPEEEEEFATFAALDVFAAASGGMKVGSVEEAAEGAKAKDPLATAALIYTPATTAARLAAVAAGLKAAYETAYKEAAGSGGKPKARGKAKKDEPATVADPGTMKGWLAEANGSIALLGRTLMEVDGAERDACVQVSSAFTTHEAIIEVDFFVAVDDYAAATPGIPDVGQMGDSQHTAGTFYRYATINLHALVAANKGDTDLSRRLARAFVEGFINTLPDSGQTNAAAWTLPDLVHLAARSDRPVNLSTAFDKPIRGGRAGHATPSTERLAEYAATIQRLTSGRGLVHAVHAHTGTGELPGLGEAADSYDQATDAILDKAFGSPQ